MSKESCAATTERSRIVAETILAQLGGRQFLAMTGARNLSSGVNASDLHCLNFKIPTAKDGINIVRIQLNAFDLYDVEFISLHAPRYETKIVAEYTMVDCAQLRSLFTSATGLDTHL